MKRILAFVILLTLPLGFLIGAHKAVGGLQDDVTVTPAHVYGDPERVAGVTFRTLTTCGNHMWWYTDHTPGDPGVTETEFHFSQKGHGFFDLETDWQDFNLTTNNGMGMSTSGGDGLEFADEGMGILLNAVAEKTLPGETREETMVLSDYFEYYPLEYTVNLRTEDYFLDEMYDPIRHAASSQGPWEEMGEKSYRQWNEYFRFPVQPGDTVNVIVGKDDRGAVMEIGLHTDGNENGVHIGFTAIAAENGMYFAPVFQRWNSGEVIESGEYVYGYGLYYIPLKPAEGIHGDRPAMTFDFEGLELVHSLAPTDRLIAMEESADGMGLHLLTMEDGIYIYSLLDISGRELLDRTEILQTDADARWAFYPEQELLYLMAGDKAALVTTGEKSRVEFTAAWPEEVQWVVPTRVRYTGGVLYGTSLEWHEQARGVCLMALDEKGLGYLGYYISNLNGSGYNSSWVNLEEGEFAE